MAERPLALRLSGGYSRFLQNAVLDLKLVRGLSAAELKAPVAVVHGSRPLEIQFRVRPRLRAGTSSGIRWRLAPEGSIRLLVLFPRNPFLGNFRVPPGFYGFQWDLEAEAESEVRQASDLLLQVDGRTRLYQSWVTLLPTETPFLDGLREAWSACPDPFDPDDVRLMRDYQVVVWKWSGRARVQARAAWQIGQVWQLPAVVPRIRTDVSTAIGAWTDISLNLEQAGQFELRVRRRGKRCDFRVRRSGDRSLHARFYAGVGLSQNMELEGVQLLQGGLGQSLIGDLSRPALQRLNSALARAISRRADLAFALEGRRWRSRSVLLQAQWSDPTAPDFATAYRLLLQGQVPPARAGLRLAGRILQVHGRRFALQIHLLDRLRFGSARERRSEIEATVGPLGEMIIQRREALEKTSYGWNQIQLLKLIWALQPDSEQVRWVFYRESKWQRRSLQQVLRMGLFSGIVPQYDLPPQSSFPLRAEILWVTLFSPEGLERLRTASAELQWEAMVRAVELVEPERYAPGSPWRDWIDSPEVRRRIDEDPVQSWLTSRYPLPGRRELDRRGIVHTYRQVRRFLDLLQRWRDQGGSAGQSVESLEPLDSGLDLPVFLFFHLLCPAGERQSAGYLRGGVEQFWGDPELIPQALT